MAAERSQITIRIRGWETHPGWVVVTARKAWFSVAARQTSSRVVGETWFNATGLAEAELVQTALQALADALNDRLS